MFKLSRYYSNADSLLVTLFGLAIQFVGSLNTLLFTAVAAVCVVNRVKFWVETNYSRHCGLKCKMKFPVTHFKCMVIMLGLDAYYAVVTSRFSLLHMKYLIDMSPWLKLCLVTCISD